MKTLWQNVLYLTIAWLLVGIVVEAAASTATETPPRKTFTPLGRHLPRLAFRFWPAKRSDGFDREVRDYEQSLGFGKRSAKKTRSPNDGKEPVDYENFLAFGGVGKRAPDDYVMMNFGKRDTAQYDHATAFGKRQNSDYQSGLSFG